MKYDVAISRGKDSRPLYLSGLQGRGERFTGICEMWDAWIKTQGKSFSVSIGSIGEPTEHPEFLEFLKTVYRSGISPSYMTSGVIIGTPGDPRAQDILDCTEKYCSGVDLIVGEKTARSIKALSETGVKITLHHTVCEGKDIQRTNEWIKKYENLKHIIHPGLDINHKPLIDKEKLKSEILIYGEQEERQNIMLKDNKIIFTKNCLNLKPIEIYEIRV